MTEQRVVLVTGATSGIGLHTASLLMAEGYRVFGAGLGAAEMDDHGFEALDLDITSDDSVTRCVEEVIGRAGALDVLINNAGVGLLGMVEETSFEEALALFEVFKSLSVRRQI